MDEVSRFLDDPGTVIGVNVFITTGTEKEKSSKSRKKSVKGGKACSED